MPHLQLIDYPNFYREIPEKMNTPTAGIRRLTTFLGLSVLVHLLVMYSIGRSESYNPVAPVNPLQAVMPGLSESGMDSPPIVDSDDRKTHHADKVAKAIIDEGKHAPVQDGNIGTSQAVPEKNPVEEKPVEPVVLDKEKSAIIYRSTEPPPQPAASGHALFTTPPPLRTVGEFLTSENEKLSFLVSLRGVPVGSMELEAKNKNGEVWLTLRTRSNATLSGMYPFDDIIQTRHLGGNFIITNVRQQGRAFSSDIGFSIFLRERRVFWIDRIRKRSSNETIPNSDVLDALSSFYYLRNRPLQVGKTETLHIYDGDTYAPLPIEIVRQEQVQLRSLKKVDTLLLRNVQQKRAIFKRIGDMRIWVTNDDKKMPVKIEATTQLGKVIVELVSAESQSFANAEMQK